MSKSLSACAAHNRAQLCFYIAENLEIRKAEFGSRISAMTGASAAEAEAEVAASISRLFTWAAWAAPRWEAEAMGPFHRGRRVGSREGGTPR